MAPEPRLGGEPFRRAPEKAGPGTQKTRPLRTQRRNFEVSGRVIRRDHETAIPEDRPGQGLGGHRRNPGPARQRRRLPEKPEAAFPWSDQNAGKRGSPAPGALDSLKRRLFVGRIFPAASRMDKPAGETGRARGFFVPAVEGGAAPRVKASAEMVEQRLFLRPGRVFRDGKLFRRRRRTRSKRSSRLDGSSR